MAVVFTGNKGETVFEAAAAICCWRMKLRWSGGRKPGEKHLCWRFTTPRLCWRRVIGEIDGKGYLSRDGVGPSNRRLSPLLVGMFFQVKKMTGRFGRQFFNSRQRVSAVMLTLI